MIVGSIKRFPIPQIFSKRRIFGTLICTSPIVGDYMAGRMALSQFLADSKQHYLQAVQEGRGREWIVAMGNEAGDLDSVASSIAYSWFSSTVQKAPCVSLLQTSRADLSLRLENIHAFELASISAVGDELLCIDDIRQATRPFPSNRFVLVDHNRLLPQFLENNEDVRVVAVLDHHEDEGLYHDTAEPRKIIVPTGSASSIVAQHIEQHSPDIPSDLARLLLCAILVDTNGLKPGGKAEELDRAATTFLLSHSDIGAMSTFAGSSAISALSRDLLEKKADVSHLSTKDLLRRDFKQYTWVSQVRTVQVGLSTVPLDLRAWLARDSVEVFWHGIDDHMDDRKLDILGVLTTFRKEKHLDKRKQSSLEDESHKGKHKRQILIVIRDVPGGTLQERLRTGIEEASELSVERRSLFDFVTKYRCGKDKRDVPSDAGIGSRIVFVYKQGNAKATRKVIAPLMKKIIEQA